MSEDTSYSSNQNKIEWSLFLLRLGVFIVMFVWTLDKLMDPGHASRILEGFYFISGTGDMIIIIIGALEMALIFAFLAGMWKKYTYGFIMVLHGLTTFSSWKQYLDMNLLFFAAWPMMAACVALYLLRDLDVKYTLRK